MEITLEDKDMALCDDGQEHLANVVVVHSVPAVATDDWCSWLAVLNGALMCDVTYVRYGGGRGKSLMYKPALAKVRKFYITNGFKSQDPAIHKLIVTLATNSTASRWSELPSRDEVRQGGREWESNVSSVVIYRSPNLQMF